MHLCGVRSNKLVWWREMVTITNLKSEWRALEFNRDQLACKARWCIHGGRVEKSDREVMSGGGQGETTMLCGDKINRQSRGLELDQVWSRVGTKRKESYSTKLKINKYNSSYGNKNVVTKKIELRIIQCVNTSVLKQVKGRFPVVKGLFPMVKGWSSHDKASLGGCVHPCSVPFIAICHCPRSKDGVRLKII